jgi:hypothetical protein
MTHTQHFKIEIIRIEVGNKSFKCSLPVKIIVYIYIYMYRFEHDCEVKSGRRSKQRRAAGGSTLQVQTEAAAGAHLCLVDLHYDLGVALHALLYIPRGFLFFVFFFIYLFIFIFVR